MEKTPVSMLQELCDQESDTLLVEFLCETSSQMFICSAKAMGVTANAMARSKKEAKHEACANIICE